MQHTRTDDDDVGFFDMIVKPKLFNIQIFYLFYLLVPSQKQTNKKIIPSLLDLRSW